MFIMNIEVKKVSELVGDIKHLLEVNFTNVSVEGEVTNLSLSSSGHWYFTLSDKDSAISGAVFKMDALRNPQIKAIKDGTKVICVGDVNVYPKRGTFQIIVKRIVPVGTGDLKEQFEKLKRKLASEGLFDIDQKKSIPLIPKRVAIITAQRGAALQDFINIYKRRSIWMDLVVVPCLVQGDEAPKALRAALHNTIKYSLEAEKNKKEDKKIDLIVLARGGGSLEDLWAFNDEGLAYDIFNCPIPIISAIGHEVDFSISDFVADLRCETPSAAAEVITHHQTMIKEKMRNAKMHLLSTMNLKLSKLENSLKKTNPHSILSLILKRFNDYQRRLRRCEIHRRLNELTKIHDIYLHLDEMIEATKKALELKINKIGHRLDKNHEVLNALNPKNVLNRGFSYVESDDKKIIASGQKFDSLPVGTPLRIHFYDGERKVIKDA